MTIISLRVKPNKMLNINIKFDTFQILEKEEFSKQTRTRSCTCEGCDHTKLLKKKSISSNFKNL